jgi:transposase InsO family protein
VKRACELLSLPRSSYYEKWNRPESKRSRQTRKIDRSIRAIYQASNGIYGAPKILRALLKKKWFQEERLSLKRVQKRMKKMGIKSKVIKKWKATKTNKEKIESRQNLIEQDFTTATVNQKWVTDITYIHTVRDGWAYLSSIMDLHTKKIIAWNLGKNMETGLVLKTLTHAIETHGKAEGLILHSDLGSQYTSVEYEKCLETLGISHSFSKKGCPYDNACIESFHAILKKEEVYQTTYLTFEHAKQRLFSYIEGFYNRRRMHSSIDFMTPVAKESLTIVA